MTVFKGLLRHFLAFAIVYSGFSRLQYILRGHNRNSIRIVCYHSIGETERKSFERQIRYYNSKYNIISMTDAVNIIDEQRADYGRCLIITFDDSFRDNYEIVAPILQKYSIPACFFIVSQFVSLEKEDKERLEYFAREAFYTSAVIHNMSWAEVRELSQNGFEIGSHTETHPFLTRIPIEESKRELSESKRTIESRIGRQVQHFAFPYGTAKDLNYELRRFVKEIGYTSCSSIVKGSNSHNSDPYYLHRNVILPDWPLFMVKCSIRGGFDWVESLKKYLSRGRLVSWNSSKRGKEASYA
ncbi:polysaccharide deacetylase family protein [Candidatus Poribacteria bacterium]